MSMGNVLKNNVLVQKSYMYQSNDGSFNSYDIWNLTYWTSLILQQIHLKIKVYLLIVHTKCRLSVSYHIPLIHYHITIWCHMLWASGTTTKPQTSETNR